jgi:hypothetical protein
VVVVVVVEGQNNGTNELTAAAVVTAAAAPAAAGACSSDGAGRTDNKGPDPPLLPPPGRGANRGPFSNGPCGSPLLPTDVGELERRVQLALATKVPPKPANGVSRNTCVYRFSPRTVS